MVNFNKLALLSILTAQACAFSGPVPKSSNNKAPAQTEVEDSKKMQHRPAFTRPGSLMRQFDELFPSPFRSLSRFDDFFDSPLFTTSMDMMPFFDDIDRRTSQMMLGTTRVSPGYEISEDDKAMTLAIDVPGVKAEDITVEIEADGKMLHVSGKRVKKEGNSESESRFDKRFSIGARFDSDNVKANLADGVLKIVAPKMIQEQKETKKVEITEGSPARDE